MSTSSLPLKIRKCCFSLNTAKDTLTKWLNGDDSSHT